MLMLKLEAPGCKDSWTGTHRWAGRTLTAVEAVGEDPAAIGEAVAWTRRWWRRRGTKAVAWTRRRWRRRDIETHEEEERSCGVNLAAVGDSPTWTRRRSVIHRRGPSSGRGGSRWGPDDYGGVEAVEERAGTWVPAKRRRIVALGFKGQTCD
jgi:hypothetical protein